MPQNKFLQHRLVLTGTIYLISYYVMFGGGVLVPNIWLRNQRNFEGGRLLVRPSASMSLVPMNLGEICLDWNNQRM